MALPGFWQLIIPNFNSATAWGIFLLILAGILLWLRNFPVVKFVFGKILSTVVSVLLLVGVVLIWGISMFQDFINTPEGILIFWGTIITIVVALILFGGMLFKHK